MLRDILIQKGLSNRESEVAELVTKGLSNKEVANQLFVTEKTVKFHLTNIYKKMNVKSRAQLIVWCLPHMGFVEAEREAAAEQPAQNIQSTQQQNHNVIPAGSATVSSQGFQNTIPTGINRLPEKNNGGNDAGNGGFGN
ncbi:MAG: helix-turn-helix transcriptional regulator [Bdellovibrionaceae bacterium]|nr:helix-turn-helix transcriptional regulator [Pseudobdellovibrionaceae bacterium]|tara:strand:- start:188291 stop:188707 length:417 start_codon:yes stop_codon:yes gene_type:complete